VVSDSNENKGILRFYLREFGIPEDKQEVWRFDRSEQEPETTAIDGITEARLPGGLADSGDELSPAEALVEQVWPWVANGFADLDVPWVRRCIALVAASMIPGARDEAAALQQAFTELAADLPRDSDGLREARNTDIGESAPVFDSSSWFAKWYPTGFDQAKYKIDLTLGGPLAVASRLAEMRWSVIVAGMPWFITTDQPLTVLNGAERQFGLDTAGTFVLFPLSATRLLVIDDRDDADVKPSDYYALNLEGPALYNYLQMVQAARSFYSARIPGEVTFEVLNMLGYLYSGRM
jgi:hypothetical protein